MDTSPRLLVLHALRLSGFMSVERLVHRTGLTESQVNDILQAAAAADEAKERTGRISGWMLMPAGREAHAALLAEELQASGAKAEIERLDDAFVVLNEPFKALCTRWQIIGNPETGTPNDHTDAAYDAAVIADLAAAHPGVLALCGELTAALPRFGRYAPDFDQALARAQAGEIKAFAAPMNESYHDAWMELHQDLLSTLARERTAADGH
jgi:hypothetical protein